LFHRQGGGTSPSQIGVRAGRPADAPPIVLTDDLKENDDMRLRLQKSFPLLGRVAAATLLVGLAGCDSPGAGTIKIENPEAARSKFAGPAVPKAGSEKQAKAIEAEEEAAKKHPKLR
jgi:hypothetical protein